MGTALKIAAGIVIAIFAISILFEARVEIRPEGSSDDSTVGLTDEQAAEIETEPEPQVDWEWIDDPDCSEALGDYCWQIRVSSSDGCPNGLYAELNLLDGTGTVIDYTNDSLGVLPAGRSAILTFGASSEAVREAEVAEVNCY